jgi:hypothetical protein
MWCSVLINIMKETQKLDTCQHDTGHVDRRSTDRHISPSATGPPAYSRKVAAVEGHSGREPTSLCCNIPEPVWATCFRESTTS